MADATSEEKSDLQGGGKEEAGDASISRLQKWVVDHGVSFSHAPAAVLTHEALGASILIAAWVGCHRFRPLFQLSKTSGGKKLLNRYPKFKKNVDSLFSKEWVKHNSTRTRGAVWRRFQPGARVGAALVESTVLRKLCAPVLVPVKIVATLFLVRTYFGGGIEPTTEITEKESSSAA